MPRRRCRGDRSGFHEAALDGRLPHSKSGDRRNLIGSNILRLAMSKLPGLTIVASLCRQLGRRAGGVPTEIGFRKGRQRGFFCYRSGLYRQRPYLCGYERALDYRVDKLLGCWSVDPTRAALGASAAKAVPGRGRRTGLNAQNCINGYCIAPIPPDDHRPFRKQHGRCMPRS